MALWRCVSVCFERLVCVCVRQAKAETESEHSEQSEQSEQPRVEKVTHRERER